MSTTAAPRGCGLRESAGAPGALLPPACGGSSPGGRSPCALHAPAGRLGLNLGRVCPDEAQGSVELVPPGTRTNVVATERSPQAGLVGEAAAGKLPVVDRERVDGSVLGSDVAARCGPCVAGPSRVTLVGRAGSLTPPGQPGLCIPAVPQDPGCGHPLLTTACPTVTPLCNPPSPGYLATALFLCSQECATS